MDRKKQIEKQIQRIKKELTELGELRPGVIFRIILTNWLYSNLTS